MVSSREMPAAIQKQEKGKRIAEITRHFNWGEGENNIT
jgi:hypothetical protein